MSETKRKQASPESDLPRSVQLAVDAALDKKANQLVVLDLKTSGAFTDYFVVCSGQTGRQVKAIVDEILKELRESGRKPSHVEGYDHAQWVLVDCFDFIIHVFTQETRRFYNLESLWGSARRLEYKEPC